MRNHLIAAMVASCAVACATPLERFSARVATAGLTPQVIHGTAYDHLVIVKPGYGESLHVYVEGDGTPWQTRQAPANEPTPRTPIALELMLRDPHRSIYLGRPCYFGVVGERCTALAWTHERYSEAVVESMASALAAVAERPRPIVLIGHSGGGVLAVLLARQYPGVEVVVTVGANLDVAAWTALHGYSPLEGSLDPARLPPTAAGPRERHYVGSDDHVVPPSQLRDYARGRKTVEVIEWKGFDHVCCWAAVWPEILSTIEAPEDVARALGRNLPSTASGP